MRAVQFSTYGGPEVLETVEVDAPHAGPGEIVVQVVSAGINQIDTKIRSGAMAAGRPGTFPSGTGVDAAGTVVGLGEGVDDVALGDVVFGTGRGTVAEQAVLTRWALVPEGVDPVEAGGWGVPVETASRLLTQLGVESGTVLVSGASGGVGSAVVQLAVARGLRVVGTASAKNHAYLASLGATPVTYGPGLADRVADVAPGGVDGALDISGAGVLVDLVALVGDAIRVITIADTAAERLGVRFSRGGASSDGHSAFGEALRLPGFALPVERRFSLEETAAAHWHAEDGHTVGKIVVVP